MLAGHVKNPGRLQALQRFCQRVELLRLREVREVAGVQHEFGSHRQPVDFADRSAQRRRHVRIRVTVKTDMAVADLHEAEVAADRRSCCAEQL